MITTWHRGRSIAVPADILIWLKANFDPSRGRIYVVLYVATAVQYPKSLGWEGKIKIACRIIQQIYFLFQTLAVVGPCLRTRSTRASVSTSYLVYARNDILVFLVLQTADQFISINCGHFKLKGFTRGFYDRKHCAILGVWVVHI